MSKLPPLTTGYAYVARKSCGCLFTAIADDPNDRKTVKRRTGEWIEAGYTVERVTDDVVRAEYTSVCPHRSAPQLLFE